MLHLWQRTTHVSMAEHSQHTLPLGCNPVRESMLREVEVGSTQSFSRPFLIVMTLALKHGVPSHVIHLVRDQGRQFFVSHTERNSAIFSHWMQIAMQLAIGFQAETAPQPSHRRCLC